MLDYYEIRSITDAHLNTLTERVSKRKIETARQQAAKEVDEMVDYLVATYLQDHRDVAADFFSGENPRAGQTAAKKLSNQFLTQLRSYIQDVAKNPEKYSRRR